MLELGLVLCSTFVNRVQSLVFLRWIVSSFQRILTGLIINNTSKASLVGGLRFEGNCLNLIFLLARRAPTVQFLFNWLHKVSPRLS